MVLHTNETFAGVLSPGPALSNSARSLTDPVKGILRILDLPLATAAWGYAKHTVDRLHRIRGTIILC